MSTEKKQEQAFTDGPWTFEDELTVRLDKGYIPGSPDYKEWKENVAWIMEHIAQERADAASEAAREARVDELGQILRAMDDTVHGRLAALTTDTTKGAKQ